MAVKDVVLAGGSGSLPFPLAQISNGHLLPIYDKPMICYSVQSLVDAGVEDILIVTAGRNAHDFQRILANGGEFRPMHLGHVYMEREDGVADALALAHHFRDGHRACAVLGNKIIEGSSRSAVESFYQQTLGGNVPLLQIEAAERINMAESSGSQILRIAKPLQNPKPGTAATGTYLHSEMVFDKAKKLTRSNRNELEITDVNDVCTAESSVGFANFDRWWTEAGTLAHLLRASILVAKTRECRGE